MKTTSFIKANTRYLEAIANHANMWKLLQIDLMHDRNPEVQRLCDATLDIISLHDESWRDRVRREKFRFHNAQWLEIVEGQRAASQVHFSKPVIDLDRK